MNVTKSDVEQYLSDVFAAVNAGRYQISPRQKNQDIYMDYVFTEEDAKKAKKELEKKYSKVYICNRKTTGVKKISEE
mgnify:CR=1 FL=1